MNTNLKKELSNYTLLFVENEEGIRNNLEDIFNYYFKETYMAVDGKDGLDKYLEYKPDLIISDIKMPIMNGIDMIKQIRKKDDKTDIIILSAYTDLNYLLSSVELNLLKYIIKPITDTKLKEALKVFINKKNLISTIKINDDTAYDRSTCMIHSQNDSVQLTKKESLFLNYLLDKKTFVTYSEIEDLLWEDKLMSQNALRLFIRNFRKKLPPNLLQNLQNEGYIIKIS